MQGDFQEYIARKQREYGDRFSATSIATQFIPAFEAGDTYRVKVDFGYGKPIWGFVGITTGWVPCFLLMRRRGQHGSSETLNAKCRILCSKRI